HGPRLGCRCPRSPAVCPAHACAVILTWLTLATIDLREPLLDSRKTVERCQPSLRETLLRFGGERASPRVLFVGGPQRFREHELSVRELHYILALAYELERALAVAHCTLEIPDLLETVSEPRERETEIRVIGLSLEDGNRALVVRNGARIVLEPVLA